MVIFNKNLKVYCMYKLILIFIILSFFISCSDSSTNTTQPQKMGMAKIIGDTTVTITSNNGQFINSNSNDEYSTFQFYITEGTEVTTVFFRIKDYQSNSKEFDLSRDNNISKVSFKTGAITYNGYSGNFTILERSPNRVKATFKLKAKKLGEPNKEIEVIDGLFDF